LQSKLIEVIPTPDQFLAELKSEYGLMPSSSERAIGFITGSREGIYCIFAAQLRNQVIMHICHNFFNLNIELGILVKS
jgi:hypothetical protein